MPKKLPRSIAVIDVGATNAKVLHIGPDLSVLQERALRVTQLERPPYLHLATESVIDFAATSIRDFDLQVPVDAIVPCTHGSALALLSDAGALVLPMMSYLAEVPTDVARVYADIEPAFSEVLAPTNPGALTLGRQLLWQEAHQPEAFAQVRSILPYAQYLAYRLCGVMASEVSALGAQTHLWAPKLGTFSSLARKRGWDRLIAPLRGAAEVLGPARGLALKGRGEVLCGAHDSNANFMRYAPQLPLVLLSTGTWIIAFDSDAPIEALDGTRDQASNTTVSGDPVACARFMGGEEYIRIAGHGNKEVPSVKGVEALVADGAMALPSFTDSGGPVPQTGKKGTIISAAQLNDVELANLATLYTAQMTAITLDALGDTKKVVVDGPFGANAAYLSTLSALLPDRQVLRSKEVQGTAAGAASLALGTVSPAAHIEPVSRMEIAGLTRYHEEWSRAVVAHAAQLSKPV